MATKDWIHTKDAELAAQAPEVANKITASPTSFGLTVPEGTALQTDVTNFTNAFNLSNDPSTRTAVTIGQKNTTKAVLIARMRSYGQRIVVNPNVTDANKLALGLNLHNTKPSPVPVPSTRPIVSVLKAVEFTLSVRLADETTPDSRKKPDGVSEAEIFTFIGATAPGDLEQWAYQGQASKTSFDVSFPTTTAAGTKVWIAARWCNHRGQHGERSTPVNALIVGSVAAAA